ncbi:MAG: peptidase MA family metallohydrolase [Candidatus Omnitrophota bacterium]
MKKILLLFLVLECLASTVRAEASFRKKDNFIEKKGTHFIIYYTTDVSEDFVDSILEYAERYYDDLTDKLGFRRFDYWTWENRAKITIYPDQETFVRETKQPEWSGGAAIYELKSIWTFPRAVGFFDSLLPHEIGHIVFREVIGGKSVPLWLEEGVASYLEQAKRFGAEKAVLKAMENNTFIPLSELSKIDSDELRMISDVELFYAEAVSIVSYLIEKFGSPPFNEFCRKIKDGRSFDDALSYAYFDIRNASQLAEFWENYLRNKLKAKSTTIL